ncbi:LOW QUALITY PROTEIN: uncharacterized protein [Amphiura filiformis]|uniref:LOW QUALITY PROTEIN: uncharacterized protein n=1 Tax=Amphiura filiformis TaxID=82378 RepID=UPI003B22407C
MARLETITLFNVLCSILIVKGQYQGSHHLLYGYPTGQPPLQGRAPTWHTANQPQPGTGTGIYPQFPPAGEMPRMQGGKASGPHIGGRPHPGTGTGVYPQFPPPERPAVKPRPPPPRPVTPRPIAPVGPIAPKQPIPSVQPPTVPVIVPVNPNPAPNYPVNPVYPNPAPNNPVIPVNPNPAPNNPVIPVYPNPAPNNPVIPVNPNPAPNNPVIPVNPNPVPTGVAGSPHHTIPLVATDDFGPNIVTRRPFWPRPRPRPHPRVTEPPMPCTIHQRNPCSNRGICYVDTFTRKPQCQCRDLYAGEQCELVLKPPKNITMNNVASTFVSISWLPPPVVTKAITGFVVQYNRFGDTQTQFSPHIHPGVTHYTVRDLEPESQYTICINIVFRNITAREAVLRDQCLEIRTQPDEYKTGGISLTFMALIIGGVVLVLLFIMVLALLIQRRCLKPIREPIRTIQRAMSRRSMLIPRHQHHKHNVNHHNHLPRPSAAASSASRACGDQEAEACVKVNRIPPGYHLSIKRNCQSIFARLQTNNGNNSDYKDWALPVSVNYSRLDMPEQPPRYTRSSSCSKGKERHTSSSTSRETTELSTFGHQRKSQDLRSSRSMPHATIRALPHSVSNHVMRSKNAREKDASNEFDIRGSYMYFSTPGQNLTA